MTRNAIVLWSYASGAFPALLLTAALAPSPAAAQRTVTDESVSAMDVAKTPLTDLNLDKDQIPPVLQRARAAPYADPGLDHCAEILSEIGDLDAVLGEDFDTAPPAADDGIDTGEMAQRVVGTLIPFRSIIRTLSGADRHASALRQAIAAGLMRRAYLKGLGQAMDCPYPARPAPPEVIAAAISQREAAEAAREETAEAAPERTDGRTMAVEEDAGAAPVFVSQPVVQPER